MSSDTADVETRPPLLGSRRQILGAAVAGGALAMGGSSLISSSARATACTSSLVYRTEDEGICPGDPGAASALSTLLASLLPGAVVYFSPGTYDLSGWNGYDLDKSITLLAPENRTTLLGPGTADTASNRFLRIENPTPTSDIAVLLAGLSFENWGTTIFVDNLEPIERISIRRCRFENVHSAIFAPAGSSSELGRKICSLGIEECEVRQAASDAIVIESLFDHALVTHNRIEAISGSAIVIGSHAEENSGKDDLWRKAVITHNRCSALSRPESGAEVHAVSAVGRELIVSENHIESVSNGGRENAEGILLRARYSEVCDNTLINAGEEKGAISLEAESREVMTPGGARGYANRVCGNIILNTREGNHRGIHIHSDDTLLSQNYVEGVEYAIHATIEDPGGSLLIRQNSFRDVAHGVYLTSWGGTINIFENTMLLVGEKKQYGVYLRFEGDGPAEDVRVERNGMYVASTAANHRRGVSIRGSGVPVSGLSVRNNEFADLTTGIYGENESLPSFSLNGAWFRGNLFRNCSTDVSEALRDLSGAVICEGNLSA